MNISKKTWHYRWMHFIAGDEVLMPKSLCTYFWTLVISLTLFPFTLFGRTLYGSTQTERDGVLLTTGFGAIFTFIILFILVMFLSPFLLFLTDLNGELSELFLVLTVFDGVIILSVLGWWIKNNLHIEYKSSKSDPVISSFFKAKKDKVCPKIDYTE